MKKKTVIGLRLKCATCGKTIIIGSKGIPAAKARAYKHMVDDRCACEFIPVNAPKGLTYIGDDGEHPVVYSGDDFDGFWNDVKTMGLAHRTVMSPKLELSA
jgi:hypothetical protein